MTSAGKAQSGDGQFGLHSQEVGWSHILPIAFMHTLSASRTLSDVQDILYHIFCYLDPERSTGEDTFRVRQTLIHSAISCKNFTDPALNALWRCLPNQKPLTSLLYTLDIAQDRTCLARQPLVDGSYVRMYKCPSRKAS